jgi:hypothetical protein
MATDQRGDVSLVVAGSFQNVYLISLFTGKLLIAHGVLLLTWRLEKHAYASAACLLIAISKVALKVESTICDGFTHPGLGFNEK